MHQISVFSSTTYLIYINDLLSATYSPIRSFAVDSILSSSYGFRDLKTNSASMEESVSALFQIRVAFNATEEQHCIIQTKHNVYAQPISHSKKVFLFSV